MSLEKKTTESGAKAHQRQDTENRVLPYSLWHRTLHKSLYMLDVDFVEWRFKYGKMIPVGVMEVTRVDNGKTVDSHYCAEILERYDERDFQGRATRIISNALGTKSYIVLFREDCSEFWVFNLTDNAGWAHYNPSEMEAFLKSL
jgi:hypothetical protein